VLFNNFIGSSQCPRALVKASLDYTPALVKTST